MPTLPLPQADRDVEMGIPQWRLARAVRGGRRGHSQVRDATSALFLLHISVSLLKRLRKQVHMFSYVCSDMTSYIIYKQD